MGSQGRLIQNLQLFAGAALIGLGTLILAGNLASIAAHFSHLLGITAEAAETLGPLNTAGAVASQAFWAYFFDHQEFLRGLHRILISFWPVLLVITGSVMWRNGFTGSAAKLQKKCPACRSHCSSFDVKVDAGFARPRPDGIASH
jgi:hypothetical protein